MKTKLSNNDITSKIKNHTFTNLPSGKVIICEIVLENGFTVRGESAVVDPVNFIQDVGEKIAYEDAVNQIWQLEGYLLQQILFENK